MDPLGFKDCIHRNPEDAVYDHIIQLGGYRLPVCKNLTLVYFRDLLNSFNFAIVAQKNLCIHHKYASFVVPQIISITVP